MVMFFGNTVDETRQLFYTSWRKHCQHELLNPLEHQLVTVIMDHPEYHALFKSENARDQSYFPEMGETNPFLHMGLHLAIRDQIDINRPNGVAESYSLLLKKFADKLVVEHKMMECLAECLWQAQRNHSEPNEQNYLQALSLLLQN
jgi:hypothetical protein